MTNLQELALERCLELNEEINKAIMAVGRDMSEKDSKFNMDKHQFPIMGKLHEVKKWLDAILEENS